jgi:group I intron endonuclease
MNYLIEQIDMVDVETINKKLIVIYKIQSPSNKIYIGQSRDWVSRKSKYKKLKCKTQHKIYRSLLKYGYDSHTVEILEYFSKNVLQEDLNIKEIYYWEYYKNLGFAMLNVRYPGSNEVASIETKLKQSKAHSGKNNAMFGKYGKDHPAFGNVGHWKNKPKEEHPRFGTTGEKSPLFGRTGSSHPMFGIVRGDHQSAKKVINTITNQVFLCAKDAAEHYNINYNSLTSSLRRKSKNKNSLQYVKDFQNN